MAGDATSDATAAVGIGLNAATGNWIGAAIGAVGLGLNIFGGAEQSGVAKQAAQVSAQIAGLENQENDVRHQAMLMSARRNDIETLRTAQRARALGIQAGATQTGSLTGSGVTAGIQNTEAQGAWGLQGTANQVSFGNQIYGIDQQIGANRVQLAQLGGKMSSAQGLSSLGGALMQAGPYIGKFAANFGGFGNKS